MSARRRQLLLAGFAGQFAASRAAAMEKLSDRIELPPQRRESRSADGGWLLVVEAIDAWQSPRVSAQLLRQNGAAAAQKLWQQALPHEYGPREVWLSAEGQVLLIDEWIRVASRRALMLLDAKGQTLATHAHADIAAALGISQAQLSRQARRGQWISAGPTLSADGRQLSFEAGGGSLSIDLQRGGLLAAARR